MEKTIFSIESEDIYECKEGKAGYKVKTTIQGSSANILSLLKDGIRGLLSTGVPSIAIMTIVLEAIEESEKE